MMSGLTLFSLHRVFTVWNSVRPSIVDKRKTVKLVDRTICNLIKRRRNWRLSTELLTSVQCQEQEQELSQLNY